MTGFLWESENGDDAMDEINVITPGSNGGWIQIIGPLSRLADYKQIESSFTPLQGNLPVAGNLPFSAIDPNSFIPALQQVRWPPALIANSRSEALSRLFVLPGSHCEEPIFAGNGPSLPPPLASPVSASDHNMPVTYSSVLLGHSLTTDISSNSGSQPAAASSVLRTQS